ncbi:MAG: hypothetical protein NC247_14775 [Ruminococcus flavefaciens]|nr:hypothetical protein [Ruminococcus flavefaciens]
MAWIEPITYETASGEVKTIIDQRGHEILKSNKVSTLLKNAIVYDSVEINGWRMDAELQRLVSKRMGDLLEYVISKENNSYICTNYFTKCLAEQGIDFETTEFTEEEKLIIEYGQAIARDFHNIPQDLKDRLKKAFTEEQIVVITGMAVVITADNYFETILDLR